MLWKVHKRVGRNITLTTILAILRQTFLFAGCGKPVSVVLDFLDMTSNFPVQNNTFLDSVSNFPKGTRLPTLHVICRLASPIYPSRNQTFPPSRPTFPQRHSTFPTNFSHRESNFSMPCKLAYLLMQLFQSHTTFPTDFSCRESNFSG
jgi:hypothetical protein